MAGAIRGIDPRDNVYTYAHAAGKHFRKRASVQVGDGRKRVVTTSPKGSRVQTVTIRPLGRTRKTLAEIQDYRSEAQAMRNFLSAIGV